MERGGAACAKGQRSHMVAGIFLFLVCRSMAGSEKAADPADDSFAVPLCLWQRAAFLSPPSSSGSSAAAGEPEASSRGERDSLRLRIAQLKHEYWRE